MFLNTLQIIAHMPLLNLVMPANAHYCLAKYLNIVRLYSKRLNTMLRGPFNMKRTSGIKGLYNVYMQLCEYEHLYSRNLVIVIALAIVFLVVGIALRIRYVCTPRKADKKLYGREPSALLRLFYEMFFEICLCILINLSLH